MATKWINTNGGDWNTAANWDNGVPSPTSQAIFDAASFAANGKVITASALMQCQGLDVSAADQTFTIQSAVYGLELYGNFVGSTNCTFAMTGTAYVYSKATMTLTTNGKSLAWNRWYIDAVGGTVTNGDDCNLGGVEVIPTQGAWTTNNKNINLRFFNGDISTLFTLNLGASSFTCSTQFYVYSSNITVNVGTSLITATGISMGSGRTFYDVTINSAGTSFMYGVFTCRNFTVLGSASASIFLIQAGTGAAVTVTNILTLTGNSAAYRLLLYHATIGTQRTLTFDPSKAVISNVDFQDINCPNAIDLSANFTVGNCGGNSGITFCPAQNLYVVHTSGAMSVSNVAKWVTTDGGSTQARVPLPQDRAWGTANSFTGASTVTMDCPRIGSIDLSGVSQAVIIKLVNDYSCYGNFVLGINITIENYFYLYLRGRGNWIINTYGVSVFALSIDSYSGIYTNMSLINTVYGSGTAHISLSVASGALLLNGYDTNVNRLSVASGATLNLGNGTMTIYRDSASTAVFIGGTIICLNSTIKFYPITYAGNLTIDFGGKTFNNIWFSGFHTGNFDITGNNTFNNIKIDAGRKVRFTAGTTQNIANLNAVGTAVNPITISSVTTSPYNITYNGRPFNLDYLNISYCNFSKPNTFFAGLNSTDSGNNTNIVFGQGAMSNPQFIESEIVNSFNLVIGNILRILLSENEVISLTLGAESFIEQNFIESEELLSILLAKGYMEIRYGEYDRMLTEYMSKVFTSLSLSEYDQLISILSCKSFSQVSLEEKEELLSTLVLQKWISTNFTEADELYELLIAKASFILNSLEEETLKTTLSSDSFLGGIFSEEEYIFFRYFEKLKGISYFHSILKGRGNFNKAVIQKNSTFTPIIRKSSVFLNK